MAGWWVLAHRPGLASLPVSLLRGGACEWKEGVCEGRLIRWVDKVRR